MKPFIADDIVSGNATAIMVTRKIMAIMTIVIKIMKITKMMKIMKMMKLT